MKEDTKPYQYFLIWAVGVAIYWTVLLAGNPAPKTFLGSIRDWVWIHGPHPFLIHFVLGAVLVAGFRVSHFAGIAVITSIPFVGRLLQFIEHLMGNPIKQELGEAFAWSVMLGALMTIAILVGSLLAFAIKKDLLGRLR